MRIALIDPSLFTLPYDAALAGGLRAEGHAVTLHGRVPGPDDNAAGDVKLTPSFYRVTTSRPVASLPRTARLGLKGVDHFLSMGMLARRLARERPDVIHFQWLPLPVVDRLFLPGLRRIAPLVLTVHDTNPFNGNPAAGLQRIGAASVFRHFDRLIVHTEQGRDRLHAQVPEPQHIAVLPHGLLGESPPSVVSDPMQGMLTFLLFGKIKPYKGADLLLEAFGRLPLALRAQGRIRIVGKPYMDLAPLHALAALHGLDGQFDLQPVFVGDDEVSDLFGSGTIAVFPYREIEASGVLGLAITYGRPILASRLGGFADSVIDGVHGRLVLPGDVDALAEAMAQFLGDRDFAARCAGSVRELATAVPTWRQIARRTSELYESIGR